MVLYTGTLRDPADRPLANTEFEVHFTSRGLERPPVTFTTDERGRYRILWPHEPVATGDGSGQGCQRG